MRLLGITQIKESYYLAFGRNTRHEAYQQYIEQSFSAELFHRFKNIMEMDVNSHYYKNLILHFDITKASSGMRPDLVLHESQGNRNNQEMFIEVKTDPRADLHEDFQKLINATGEYLNFKIVVLITANRNFVDLMNLVEDFDQFRNLDYERRKRIHFISIIDEGEEEVNYEYFGLKFLKKTRHRWQTYQQ